MIPVIRQRILKIAAYFLLFGVLTTKSYALLPPVILVPPSDISVQNGDTFTLNVFVASVLATPTFTWLQNGKAISVNTNVTVTSGKTNVVDLGGLVWISTLTMKSAFLTNAGTYSVKVTNGGGSVTSGGAIVIVLATTISNVVNVVTTGVKMTTSGFNLQFSAPTGSNVVVEASSDLQHWTPIVTNLVTSGGISVTDTLAKNYPSRYYRAHTQ